MSSPAYELTLHLELSGVGSRTAETGWALSTGTEPKSPDNVVTLYDYTNGAEFFADEELAGGALQVRTRSKNYNEAYIKQVEVRRILSAVINQQVEDNYYIGVWAVTGPMCIGRDDNDRHVFTTNYRLETQPTEEVSS